MTGGDGDVGEREHHRGHGHEDPHDRTGGRDVATMTRRQCERYFRRQGLPHLVEGHSVSRDVFGRSAPFLVVVLVLEGLGYIDDDWSWWQNTLAVVGSLVAFAVLWGLLNRMRGRPWTTLPQSVGRIELAFFVLAPAIAAFVVQAGWLVAVVVAVFNVLLLGAIRVLVGLGTLSSLWWGAARLADELGSSLRRMVRLLPLVLIFSIVLFINTEVWQVFDRISGEADVVLALFFVVLIVVLTAIGARREADRVIRDASVDGARAATSFTTPQRRNVVAMVASTQLLQVLVVSAATGAFFVLLGVLAITPEVRQAWDVGAGWNYPLQFRDAEMVIDRTLLRVALALATFNGLYLAMNVQVDATYRAELVDDITGQLHEVIGVREHYLQVLDTEAVAPAARAAA